MGIAVFLGVQLCVLLPASLGFPVVRQPSLNLGPAANNRDDKSREVHSSWISNSEFRDGQLPQSFQNLPPTQSRKHLYPLTPAKAPDTSIKYKDANIPFSEESSQKLSQTNHLAQKGASKSLPLFTKTGGPETPPPVLQFQQYKHSGLSNKQSVEYAIPANQAQSQALQLAVNLGDRGQGENRLDVGQWVITLATSLAALFSLGVVIGIFGCCCKKRQRLQSDENENKNEKAEEEGDIDKKPSQVFNPR